MLTLPVPHQRLLAVLHASTVTAFGGKSRTDALAAMLVAATAFLIYLPTESDDHLAVRTLP